MNRILASVFLLFLTVSTAYSLECYHCDSSQSSFCNVGFLSFLMPKVDCSKQSNNDGTNLLTSWIPKQCVKITAKDAEGSEYVARGCIPYSGGACNIILSTLGFFSELGGGARDVNCHTCDGDKCNSSYNVKPSVAATLILSLMLLFYKL